LQELIEERINLLLLDTRCRTSPLLKTGRIPSPKHRKPRLTSSIKKVLRALRFNKNLEEFNFEVLIRGGEGIKKNVTRPTDKRMPANRLGRVGGIVT